MNVFFCLNFFSVLNRERERELVLNWGVLAWQAKGHNLNYEKRTTSE